MFKLIIKKVKQFHKDEDGDIVQVSIITAIFAVIAIGGLIFLQPKIKAMFTKSGGALDQGSAVSY